MRVTCQHCGRTLEYSGERPSFCAYCGQRLASTVADRTIEYRPDEAGEATWTPENVRGVALSTMPAAVGGYKLKRPLGTGGMGTVYEAEDANSGRPVAVKLISSEVAVSSDAVERFRQEGRLASTISHPRCVFVIAADEEQGRPYIVMELMTGLTLKELVERHGRLPPERAIPKILDVIDGLIEAHQLGVVHRDVKPSNCFLEPDGRVKIGDFGLAKSLVGQGHMTRTGQFLGTPLFASPEQIRGEEVDPQSDVYSVAATLYFLLTGQAPFEHADAAVALARIVSEPPPSLRSLRPDLPPALDRVVLRGLERDRAKRYRSLEEFREALVPFLPGQLSIGALGLRLGAYLIDWVLFVPLAFLARFVMMTLLGEQPSLATRVAASIGYHLIVVVPWLAYFIWMESRWGCSLGKRVFRLRVNRVDGGGPPGLRAAAIRTLVFYGLIDFISHVIAVANPAGAPEWRLLALAMQGIGLFILTTPMRAKNGYQGIHEVLSGTQVVRLPWPKPRHTYPDRTLEQHLFWPDDMPATIGPYRVGGTIKWTAEERLALGEDPALHRKVWIWMRPATAPTLSSARRETSRATRLRWLGGGTADGYQWDAFFAPTGSDLVRIVDQQRRLSWTEARSILEQLADELAASCADGILPNDLTPEQVWVQPNGRIYLLAVRLFPTDTASSESGGLTPNERSLAFLRQTARFMLTGRREEAGKPLAAIAAPVPLHARKILDRLSGVGAPYTRIEEVCDDLARTRGLPTEIGTGTRAGHLVVLGVLLFFGLTISFLAARLYAVLSSFTLDYNVMTGKALLAVLDRPEHRHALFASGPNPPSDAEIRALRLRTQERLRVDERMLRRRIDNLDGVQLSLVAAFLRSQILQLSQAGEKPLEIEFTGEQPLQMNVKRCSVCEHYHAQAQLGEADLVNAIRHLRFQPQYYEDTAAIMALAAIALFPAVWVVWAVIFRGGLSYHFVGAALLRKNGRPALRVQCGWRALVTWLPIVVLLALSVVADARLPEASWLASLLWWLALALLPLYLVLGLRWPGRSLHDRLAGTYLVPR